MSERNGAHVRLLNQLQPLDPAEVMRPKLPISDVVADARALQAAIRQPVVRTKLLELGVSPWRLAGLSEAILALDKAERERLRVASSRNEQISQATWLRAELLAACKFNLRRRAPAGAFERITDSEHVEDLIHDLRELHQLVSENSEAFDDDFSFDVHSRSTETVKLLDGLERLRSSAGRAAHRQIFRGPELNARDLRDRAYTHLLKLSAEIRAAGTYGFRRRVDLQRLFVSVCPDPNVVSLRSALRALGTSLGPVT